MVKRYYGKTYANTSSGFMHLAAGLSVGLTGLAAGYAIGIVGDSVGIGHSEKETIRLTFYRALELICNNLECL
jgi:F0F1-type ATP synthase membrane subunit c/vacuolar-type H+-ATPase subunit K